MEKEKIEFPFSFGQRVYVIRSIGKSCVCGKCKHSQWEYTDKVVPATVCGFRGETIGRTCSGPCCDARMHFRIRLRRHSKGEWMHKEYVFATREEAQAQSELRKERNAK